MDWNVLTDLIAMLFSPNWTDFLYFLPMWLCLVLGLQECDLEQNSLHEESFVSNKPTSAKRQVPKGSIRDDKCGNGSHDAWRQAPLFCPGKLSLIW